MSGVQRGRWRTRRVVSLGVTLALGALLTAALTSGASASKSAKATARSGPYTFVLSNNFLGNDWRPQVERLAQLTANIPPFKGKVNVKIVNSADTNEAQISDLNNIIQTKPAAILLIPGSTTALNPTIQRACNAGILVFTLSAPVAVPCVYNLNESFYQGNLAMGQWMAKALGGKGSIFVDQGVAGLGISQSIENGFMTGLHKYGPGHHGRRQVHRQLCGWARAGRHHEPARGASERQRHHDAGLLHARLQRAQGSRQAGDPRRLLRLQRRDDRMRYGWSSVRDPDQHAGRGSARDEDRAQRSSGRNAPEARRDDHPLPDVPVRLADTEGELSTRRCRCRPSSRA